MVDKLRAVFDSRSTWLMIGTIAGVFGEKAVAITNVIGNVVMAIL